MQLIYSFVNMLNEMSPYILLGFLFAGLLHEFINEKTLTKHLAGKGWTPVLKAAAIGVPLPLCSCGVLPTAVSLRRQGASKAATTSFLIATPQTGVDSIMATYSLLGLPFALIRPIAALLGAVFGGMAVGLTDKQSDDNNSNQALKDECNDGCCASSAVKGNILQRLWNSVRYAFVEMIDNMGKWLVIGLVVATLITVFVPDELFVSFRDYPLIAMIIVVLIAIPMYICATGSIPIAMSLMLKGLTPGVAFVLLMAGPAANFASIIILNRTIGKRATAVYIGSVVVTAILFGLIIDYLLPVSWFAVQGTAEAHCCHLQLGWFETLCSALLVLLLIMSAIRLTIQKRNNNTNPSVQTDMTTTFKIDGMNCMHCRATVEKTIAAVEGVESVTVDLASGIANVTISPTAANTFTPEQVITAVQLAGFEAKIMEEK